MISRRSQVERFPRLPGTPPPLHVKVSRPVAFSDVDPMGIVWFGRYPLFVEFGAGELGRLTGMSYEALKSAGLLAPVAHFSIDYVLPMRLSDEIVIRASMIWSGSAKLNTEYHLSRVDGTACACAYATQMLVDIQTGQPYWTIPPYVETFNAKWAAGEFACLQHGDV